MHLILFKQKNCRELNTRTVDCLQKANLWTDNCSGRYFTTTVYVISKCRKCLFVCFVTDSVYLLVWTNFKQPKPLQSTGVEGNILIHNRPHLFKRKVRYFQAYFCTVQRECSYCAFSEFQALLPFIIMFLACKGVLVLRIKLN